MTRVPPALAIALLAAAAGGARPAPAHASDATAASVPAPPGEVERREALWLLARDDAASLDRALELLSTAERLGQRDVAADRALARLLAASALREDGAHSVDGAPLIQASRRLRDEALDELRPVTRQEPRTHAVDRTLVVYYGLDGQEQEVADRVARARAERRDDPWFAFAELSSRTRGQPPEAALPALLRFAAEHPTFLRVRFQAARAEADLGRPDEALALLDGLLAANPDHGRAKELKAALLAPPPVRLETVPIPTRAPPPRPPGYLPRKPTPPAFVTDR